MSTGTHNTEEAKMLYICDNGAVYCREHLGVTAKMTGRDISGQPIYPVREEAAFTALTCETCGK